jgi:hypothetical protein
MLLCASQGNVRVTLNFSFPDSNLSQKEKSVALTWSDKADLVDDSLQNQDKDKD